MMIETQEITLMEAARRYHKNPNYMQRLLQAQEFPGRLHIEGSQRKYMILVADGDKYAEEHGWEIGA